MPLLILLFALNFLPQNRPYTVGYNFQVTIDSIAAQDSDPLLLVDSVRTNHLTRGQTLVVAQFQTVPNDTIDSLWVRVGTFVAADTLGSAPQAQMMWMRESEMLDAVVPDLFVSKAIHAMSLRAYLWRVVTLGFLLYLVLSRFLQYFDTTPLPTELKNSKTQKLSEAEILKYSKTQKLKNPKPIMLLDPLPTAYPTLLAAVAAIAAALSSSVSQGEWIDFYFSPTINPFSAANSSIALVLTLIWLALMLFITTITEVFRLLNLPRALYYSLSVPGVCTLVVWLLIQDLPLWLTWTIAIVFVAALLFDYFKRCRTPYACGKCGAPLRRPGACPHCGAENKI